LQGQSGEGHRGKFGTESLREIARNLRVLTDSVAGAGNLAHISRYPIWNGWGDEAERISSHDFEEAKKSGNRHYMAFPAFMQRDFRLADTAARADAGPKPIRILNFT